MSTCPSFEHLLVFPHLRVQNANAISSPLTHGFPSMSAFLGLMWALERKAVAAGLDLAFSAVGVVCHDYQEQVSEGYTKRFRLTRNPVGKDGSTAAIVEEGRIHLDITLILAVSSPRWYAQGEACQADIDSLASLLAGMRVAGGSLIPPAHPGRYRHRPYAVQQTGERGGSQDRFRHLRLRLTPGFALVARDDLLDARAARLQSAEGAGASLPHRLEAWLSLSRVNWHYRQEPAGETEQGGKEGKGAWQHDRQGGGWIVPIPVGYGALGDLQPAGSVAQTRDATTPFRFVESLYSVGEWISPHRLEIAEDLLWYGDTRAESGSYRCRNDYRPRLDPFADLND